MSSIEGRLPTTISPPPAEGKGINEPQPNATLPDGYIEDEYLVGGTAQRFKAVDTPRDGRWTVAPGSTADYRTRVIVRRPADPARFNGTVLVEWFNVTAIEASPDWAYLSDQLAREGAAYIGVSAQAQGVEGGKTVLDADLAPDQTTKPGTNLDSSGLKHIDPGRYGSLTHPGDAYAYDIFGQVGRAATQEPSKLLGDLEPNKVMAVGESQSATFLTTYINTVHPLAPVFDGFLVHSRLGFTAPLEGEYFTARRNVGNKNAESDIWQGVRIRSDVKVPVMIVEMETDLTFLGYAGARQPDTDRIRTWEVAGTAHADAWQIRAVIGGPRDPSIGSLLGCDFPINTGPQKEVLHAALHHFIAWVDGGDPPPKGDRLETTTDPDGAVSIARDDHGNALGGIRNPLVDVPTSTLSGDPQGDASLADLENGGSICVLFGSTTAFDQATLVDLYGDADTYLDQFKQSAAAQVEAGFLLQPTADDLNAEAQERRSLFP